VSALTVDDILAERPSLRARAKAAFAADAAAKAREYRLEAANLMDETLTALRDDFGLGEAELAGIDFEEKPYNPSTPSLLFEVDGIKLRSRYMQKRVMTKKSSEFDEEVVYDKYVTVEVFTANVWKTASNLVTLGSLV
jgi:hypothetical protein